MTLLYLQLKKELRNKTEELERVFTYNYLLTTKKRQHRRELRRELHKRSEEEKEKKREKERERKKKKER